MDELTRRLARGTAAGTENRRHQLSKLVAALEALSPLDALKRGYSIATLRGRNEPLAAVAGLRPGDEIDVLLSDGQLACAVESVHTEANDD